MNSNGVNVDKLVKYDGVFKSGLDIQKSDVDVEQIVKMVGDDPTIIGSQLYKPDLSGLGIYKPSESNGTSLAPTTLHPHGPLDKADETYTDEDGKKCKVYKNDDGSYQVEKSNGFFGRLFGQTEIEQYDANGNLVAKQVDGVTYYYDENGNLTKTTNSKFGSSTVVLYNEDGSIKAEQERKMHANGEGSTTTKREYNEDGSYTQTVTTTHHELNGTSSTTTVQTFDKNGNPTSPAEEVHSHDISNLDIDEDKIKEFFEKYKEKYGSGKFDHDDILNKIKNLMENGASDSDVLAYIEKYTTQSD